MSTTCPVRNLREDDAPAVARIFNHYVSHSFAAYAEQPLSLEDVEKLIASASSLAALGANDAAEEFVGFALLRPYSPYSTFSQTALVTYFVAPGHTGRGIGSTLLRELENQARRRGVRVLLAHVSSRNAMSLAFHRKHGFTQCGAFHDVGNKHGTPFDVVWFEKVLEPRSI